MSATLSRYTASNTTNRTKSSDTRASSVAKSIRKKTDTWKDLVIDVDEKLTTWPSERGNIGSEMGKARRKQASHPGCRDGTLAIFTGQFRVAFDGRAN